ncbi:high-affinity Zn(2+) transporter zrt1 [Geranomyces variabilis]|uniref:High-affinity Zn(2+) transporter zrt1 n=1 Tax=Geranomyces variabilis TaxID=109894 RepID=A0AAD5TEI5_9FUNG|nr:high-affinity Zn(2+) transporter zrt1 [Geranomyces variabilis]
MSLTQPPPPDLGTSSADACASSLDGSYSLQLHIAAIFIIMSLSFLGTMLPVIGRRISAARLGDLPFQCLKLLGSGVILSTAFVHMLSPAQQQLTSPCLPQVFQDYGSWAGAIAICGILFTHFIQCVAVAAIRNKHSHAPATSAVPAGAGGAVGNVEQPKPQAEDAASIDAHDRTLVHILPTPAPSPLLATQQDNSSTSSNESRATAGSVVAPSSHSHSHSHHAHHHHQHRHARVGTPTPSSSSTHTQPSVSPSAHAIIDLEQGGLFLQEPHAVHRNSHAHADDAHVHSLVLADAAEKTMTTYILELGIASHSIIIGLTLGAAREEFRSLFIALCFHQFFEGLALSTVVMDADLKRRAVAIGMVVFYSFTTPFGIALGIALSQSFSENATAALIATGVLDSLSAGILLYDGLANIIVPHFQSKNFRGASAKGQGAQFFFLWLGAFVMALIGRWA